MNKSPKRSRSKKSTASKKSNASSTKPLERNVKNIIQELKNLQVESQKYSFTENNIPILTVTNRYSEVNSNFKQYLNLNSEKSIYNSITDSEYMIKESNDNFSLLTSLVYDEEKNRDYYTKDLFTLEKDVSTLHEIEPISAQIESKISKFASKSELIPIKNAIYELNIAAQKASEIKLPINPQEIKSKSVQREDISKLKLKKQELDKSIEQQKSKVNECYYIYDYYTKNDLNNDFLKLYEEFQNIQRIIQIYTSGKAKIDEFTTEIRQNVEDINDFIKNYSRFFDKVRILTPKDIDQLIEEAKSAIEKIHQFFVFYSDDKNKFASAFKVKQKFMELAQLVSLIESKTYSIKNMVSFNDNLTVESVSTKCDEYLKAAKTAVSFSTQIQSISNNYENLISNLKELKEDMQEIIENVEQIRKETSSQDLNQNMAGNVESRIRQVEDEIAICNALQRAQNQDFSSELKDVKNLFSQYAKKISIPNDVPTDLLHKMIKQTIQTQLSEKIEENEFEYAKILAERSSKSIGKAAVDKSKEIAVNFASHTSEKTDFSKSMAQSEQNIKKHIDKLNKTSAKPESIDKIESKIKELDQNLSSQISKLQKLNNAAKDESTSLTQHDIDRVCTATSILPQIENSLLQSAAVLSPYLASIEKYTNKVQDQIKNALNGQKVNFDQISGSKLEKGEPFTKENAEKQLSKLIKAERSKGNTSDLNYLFNSIENISKTFDEFENLHKKVDDLQRMQKVINRKANETPTKLPKFAPEDASANAKSIPNLESKLNSLKKKKI